MGRKSLKNKRQKEIIEGFYVVAKQEGLENTSVAKVAKHMDINPSLILHYFKSKDELLFGFINFILDKYKQLYIIDQKKPSAYKLEKTIENLFSRDWNSLIDDGVFFSCYALIFRNENIKTEFKDLHVSLRNYLIEVIEQAVEDGVISVENPKSTAEYIFVLVEGSYYYLSLYDPKDEQYNEQTEKYKDLALSLLNYKK